MADLDVFLIDFDRKPPPTDGQVVACESAIGVRLPAELLLFFQIADGGEGFIGESYVVLWSLNEIAKYNGLP